MSVKWVKLGDVVDVIRGASPRPKGDPRYFGGTIPWVMISDVTREPGKYLSKTREGVTPEGANRSRLLKSGTLILSNSGTVCVPKILAVDGCIHDGFVAFPDLPSTIDKTFLYHYFNFIRPRIIRDNKQGITQVNLNTTIVKDIAFPLHPIELQQRILAEIEKQLSRLDATVTALKRTQANLKRYKAAVLKAAVKGKLTEQWRKEHPNVESADQLLKRILADRRTYWETEELAKMKAKGTPKNDSWKKKYKEPARPKIGNLPELPDGWVWATYDQVGRLNLGRQRAPKYHTGPNMRQYLRVQNVFEDRIDLSDVMEMDFPPEDFRKYKLQEGDLLLNEGQSPEFLGRPAIYRGELPGACFTNTLIRFRAVTGVSVEFALIVSRHHMRARRFIDEGTITTNIAHLSLGRLATVEFPLPSFTEQKAIVAKIESNLSLSEKLEVAIKTNLKRAERLRQTILQKAFSGELV